MIPKLLEHLQSMKKSLLTAHTACPHADKRSELLGEARAINMIETYIIEAITNRSLTNTKQNEITPHSR